MAGIVGMFFHAEEGRFHHHQGHILREVTRFNYLVEFFSWLDGCPSKSALVKLDEMDGWLFYNSSDEMCAAYDDHVRARWDREYDQQQPDSA